MTTMQEAYPEYEIRFSRSSTGRCHWLSGERPLTHVARIQTDSDGWRDAPIDPLAQSVNELLRRFLEQNLAANRAAKSELRNMS